MRDINDNVVVSKSYAFAVRTINCYKYMTTNKKEFVLSKQLLRCGTSIGANVEEALGGHSKKDFHAKMSIAYKEARETNYWLRLLNDTEFLEPNLANSLLSDCNELLKIIGSIIKSLKPPIPNS